MLNERFPLEQEEFVERYFDILEIEMKQNHVIYNHDDPFVKEWLSHERNWIIQQYNYYVDRNRMKPQQEDLIPLVLKFLDGRMAGFNREKYLDCDRFIEFYIEKIKELICMEKFASADFSFILQRERNLAQKEFEKYCDVPVAYRDMDIKTSKVRQKLSLQFLMGQFKENYRNIYKEYEKQGVV